MPLSRAATPQVELLGGLGARLIGLVAVGVPGALFRLPGLGLETAETMNRHRDVLAVLGLVLLVPPSYFAARWIRIYYEVSGHEQRVAAFLSGFPSWLQDYHGAHLGGVRVRDGRRAGWAEWPGRRHRPAPGDLRRPGRARRAARAVVGLDAALRRWAGRRERPRSSPWRATRVPSSVSATRSSSFDPSDIRSTWTRTVGMP